MIILHQDSGDRKAQIAASNSLEGLILNRIKIITEKYYFSTCMPIYKVLKLKVF